MEPKILPCYKCLMRSVCRNRYQVRCDELFYTIIDNLAEIEFFHDEPESSIMKCVQKLMPGVKHILPSKSNEMKK